MTVRLEVLQFAFYSLGELGNIFQYHSLHQLCEIAATFESLTSGGLAHQILAPAALV